MKAIRRSVARRIAALTTGAALDVDQPEVLVVAQRAAGQPAAGGQLTDRQPVPEMDEGSNHEAVAFAGAVGLEGLHVVAVDNSSATYGWRGGLASRFAAEGWSAVTVDGRDHQALYEAFTTSHPGRPHAVVARVEPKYV